MKFQHPEYLIALAAIPVMAMLYIWLLQWKRKTAKKIGDEKLVALLVKNYSPQKFSLKFLLIILAYAFGVIALANPRSQTGTSAVTHNGIDIMIALDVSKSMLAQDIKPTRLEKAKQLVSKLIDKLPEDRIGLVIFAGRAYVQMPLTGDHAAAKMYLSSAAPGAVATQGTVIGDALKMCYAGFNTKEKKYKAVVLISDGEDHDENALKIAKEMADEGVLINTVGVGSPEGSMILDAITNETKKDAQGNIVVTKLNETELKNIAVTGNGIYQLLSSADETASALDAQLQSMGKRSVTDNSTAVYKSFFQWFAAVALLLLVIDMFVSERTRKEKQTATIKIKKAAAALAFIFFIPFHSFSQNRDKLIKDGNDAYSKKEYKTAADLYGRAIQKDSTGEKAYFNLGNALYKGGKAQEAVRAYDAAVEKDTTALTKSASWYNKGVVLQNNNKFPECIEAYKNALKLNPNDEDARLNLQKAIKKQQQQDKQNKQNKQQQQNQQKNQPKPQPSKMTKKEAEEKLKALLQHEKNLQDRLRKTDASAPNRPEKDW